MDIHIKTTAHVVLLSHIYNIYIAMFLSFVKRNHLAKWDLFPRLSERKKHTQVMVMGCISKGNQFIHVMRRCWYVGGFNSLTNSLALLDSFRFDMKIYLFLSISTFRITHIERDTWLKLFSSVDCDACSVIQIGKMSFMSLIVP